LDQKIEPAMAIMVWFQAQVNFTERFMDLDKLNLLVVVLALSANQFSLPCQLPQKNT